MKMIYINNIEQLQSFTNAMAEIRLSAQEVGKALKKLCNQISARPETQEPTASRNEKESFDFLHQNAYDTIKLFDNT